MIQANLFSMEIFDGNPKIVMEQTSEESDDIFCYLDSHGGETDNEEGGTVVGHGYV